MAVEQDRASRVYRWWKITSPDDLSLATARVAFTSNPNTRPTTEWTDAQVVNDDSGWWVRLLVGPGGDVALAVGEYQEWVELTDAPELIVTKPGITVIT